MDSKEILDEESSCSCGHEHCNCEGECHCAEECNCHESGESCGCCGQCDCGDDCHCHDDERCSDECTCEHENHECSCHSNKASEYLALAQRIQADFENFRRHAIEDIKKARIDGQISVIETFLPCLDIFKEAKKSITDENVLKGVEMVENKIITSLESLGVKKVQSIGEVYNPHIHNVIAVVRNEELENDIIVDEYQSGYEFNGKIIRDAKGH